MFTITGTNASFATFSEVAACATIHARQHGGAAVCNARSGALLADFRLRDDGSVSIYALGAGKAMVEEWAR